MGLQCDVTKKEEVKKLAEEIMKREPEGVHLVVNNAGVAMEKGTTKIEEGENEEVDYKDHKGLSEYLLKAEGEKWARKFTLPT